MSMRRLTNAMRAQAQAATADQQSLREGIVTSYDPDSYAAKVMLQPSGDETGWLPIASLWVGNGWGLFTPPSVGDLVQVQFTEDHPGAGVVLGRLFNDEDRPVSVPAGEFLIRHQSGSFLRFRNDGTVEVSATTIQATADIINADADTINATATTTTVNGAFVVNGATTLNGPITQTGTGGGSTTAHLIGPVTVDNDLTANGISVSGHHHLEHDGPPTGTAQA